MNNFYSVVKPFVNFLNFFGLFTSSFESQPCKGKFVFSWKGLVLSILNFLILVYFVKPYDFDASYYVASNILIIAWKYLANIDALTYVLSLLYQLRKQSNIKKFLSLVNEFDSQVWSIF